jgi:hypothetical protein
LTTFQAASPANIYFTYVLNLIVFLKKSSRIAHGLFSVRITDLLYDGSFSDEIDLFRYCSSLFAGRRN